MRREVRLFGQGGLWRWSGIWWVGGIPGRRVVDRRKWVLMRTGCEDRLYTYGRRGLGAWMRTAWVMLVMVLVTAASLMPSRGVWAVGGGGVGVSVAGVCAVEEAACPCDCEAGACTCCEQMNGEEGKSAGEREGVDERGVVAVVGAVGCPCQPGPSRSGERPVQVTPGVLASRAGTLTSVGSRVRGEGEEESLHAGAVKLILVGRGLGAVGLEAGLEWRRVREVTVGELVLRRSELGRWLI